MKRIVDVLHGNIPVSQRQNGFIPMMICVFLLVVGLAYLVYLRVAHAHQ